MNFEILYGNLPLGVCVLSHDRKNLSVHYCNDSLIKALSLKSWQDKTLEDIWSTEEALTLAKDLKSPTPPHHATLSYTDSKTGSRRWALVNIEQKKAASGDVYILWATDISTSKKAEAALEEALEKADASAEQKSNFLATMSHEIRTPMQSVYGLLELIEQEKPDGTILTMVQTAKNSASGLLEILDDILDFAKMDADQMMLDHFEVPLRTLCYGIVEAMDVKVQGKPVALKTEIAQTVPFVVVGDPKRLRQVIMNLMGNAMKFTHSGSVTIKITPDIQIIPAPQKGLGLRFEIIDTGIGMPQSVADKLFQPFTQADNSTSRRFGGTGLGLSICKKLVEMMGGAIGVHSIEGKGSTFWFEIPTEEVSTDAAILNMPSLDGISVLVVEDHPKGRQEIERSLRSMGASIDAVETIAEAEKLLLQRPYDVAVIDQGLPDGLGLDLIRIAMDIRPSTGLIMYTVRDDAGLQHTLQSLGVVYLTKPASRVGLGEAVKDAASKGHHLTLEGPRRILIAEDTDSIRDVLQRQLKTLGVEADFVTNGREALDALESGQYGLLITDLHMPEMDGYALIQTIRTQDKINNRHFPVIVLTADVQMAQRQIYQSNGFDECLLKPVSLGQFRRLLIRWGLLAYHNPHDTAPAIADNQSKNPINSAIDRKALEAQMGVLDDSIIDMLGMFIELTAPLIQKILDSDIKDSKALKEWAHSLKGAARSACANHLGDLAARLQTQSEQGKPDPTLIQEIGKAFLEAKEDILSMRK